MGDKIKRILTIFCMILVLGPQVAAAEANQNTSGVNDQLITSGENYGHYGDFPGDLKTVWRVYSYSNGNKQIIVYLYSLKGGKWKLLGEEKEWLNNRR